MYKVVISEVSCSLDVWTFSLQITAALEQDEQARKQRLASKVGQLIAAMSKDSWEPLRQ